ARLIAWLAAIPRTGKGAVSFAAAVSLITSLISWGFCAIFSALLVRAMGERKELRMDFRAAGGAAYIGLGATWALGMSSSAALLQANPGSLPKALLQITGVIPITATIFLWQSGVMVLVLILIPVAIAHLSAPTEGKAVTAQMMGVDVGKPPDALPIRQRPGEWLEYSPVVTLVLGALSIGWLAQEFMRQSPINAIANLNTYNFAFLTVGLLLHWRPISFL